MKTRGFAAILVALILALAGPVQAQSRAEHREVGNSAALAGVEQGRGVFQVDIGNSKKLDLYLGVIQGTYRRMQAQGVTPDFVVVYIGPSVKYLTEAPSTEVAQEEGDRSMDIAMKVEQLDALGVRQEVCAVATRAFGVDNATLFPELDVVSDGFISVIGYQAQGYNLVPVY